MMDYRDFERHMKKIVAVHEFDNGLSKLSAEARNGSDMDVCFAFPTLIDSTIELLQEAMNDEDEWIDYWVYELNCGEEYFDGIALDANGNPIELKTIWDLYNAIKIQKGQKN